MSAGNGSGESVVAQVATLTIENKFSDHDVVKAVNGTFIFFYAIVTESSDTSRMKDLDELEMKYLKRYFQKWIVNDKNLDSRETKDLIRVRAYIDGIS